MEKKNPSFEELIRMRVVLHVPGMDAVRVRRDVPYKTGGGQPLHMDVYSPPGPPHPRPAVVLVHGGPIPRLGAKNMGLFVSYGELLAASGFVAVTFDHRFLTRAAIADAAQDVTDLVSHLRNEAASLEIDPERLALWAFSGGGPLLAPPLRERPGWLRAVIAYYALLDLQEPPTGDDDLAPELRRLFSAVDGLGDEARSAPPILVARAALDAAWLNATIDRFVQAALKKHATVDLLNHADGRHSFDILDDDLRSRQIIRHTLQFLRDHLIPEPASGVGTRSDAQAPLSRLPFSSWRLPVSGGTRHGLARALSRLRRRWRPPLRPACWLSCPSPTSRVMTKGTLLPA
jgi:acetyl esterase/lipase